MPPPGEMMPPPEGIMPPSGELIPASDSFPSKDFPAASGEGSSPEEQDPEHQRLWEERQDGVRLLQTIGKLTISLLVRNFYPVKADLFKLLPMLCINESSELEPELARDCTVALAYLGGALLSPSVVHTAVESVIEVAINQSWKAKVCVLEFLQVLIFINFAAFVSVPEETERLVSVVLRLLKDPQLEVREKAGKVLGGLLHCGFVSAHQRETLEAEFLADINKKLPKKMKEGADKAEWQAKLTNAVVRRHSGVVGICAVVSSCPYDIPPYLPPLLMVLGDRLHDPQPIPATVKRVLQDFKRTHQDNWIEHKEKFTADQLTMLTDLLVSPSYYA